MPLPKSRLWHTLPNGLARSTTWSMMCYTMYGSMVSSDPLCHSELAEEPKVLVAALPRDPAEYRRTESVTIGPKPRTRKMIGMISG